MKKIILLLFLFISINSFSYAGLWTNGDKGVTVINWRANDFVYYISGGGLYVSLYVSPYNPVPSSCSPTIEVLGSPTIGGWAWGGSWQTDWTFYLPTNSWANISTTPTQIWNTGMSIVYGSYWFGSAGWYEVVTSGTLAIYGSSCSAGGFLISGSMKALVWNGTEYQQIHIPIQFTNNKF